MTYSIVNDKLVGSNVTYATTKKKSGGNLVPKFLVIHYTASTSFDADVRTLSTSDRPASCQLVIAPDGRITQIGDFTDVLWHAGKSAWKGYSGLNRYSIGIEVTCPGPLDGGYRTWTGEKLIEGEPFHTTFAAHKNGGPERHWAVFTAAQVTAIVEVGGLLMRHYKLLEAVGHDDIAPRRKQDPGPSCPDSVFHALNGNQVDEEEVERPELPAERKLKVVGVGTEKLTFRASPSGEKRGELPEGQIVEKLAEQGDWTQVRTPAGYVGFVYSKFVEAVP